MAVGSLVRGVLGMWDLKPAWTERERMGGEEAET